MVTKKAAGLGHKKPQLDISIDRLELDPKNPRLSEEAQGSSQDELITHMFDNFELDEIAQSMAKNGYFDEEPLVVIPKKLPRALKTKANRDTPEGKKTYLEFIQNKDTEFVVAEGNRRLATAKLLNDQSLRARLRRGKSWQIPSPEVLEDISILPVIVYPERVDVLPYLGVRHITGNKKWDSYAKARYIDEMLKAGKTVSDVEQDVGDKGQAVRKSAVSFNLLRIAKSELNYDITKAKENFSLLLLAVGGVGIKQFLGWTKTDGEKIKSIPLSGIDLDNPISDENQPKLRLLLEFLYGDGNKLQPAINDSRDITNYLGHVLTSETATKHLILTRNLIEAYELSDGEEVLIQKLLQLANNKLERALGIAHRHPTEDVIAEVRKCLATAIQLNKSLEPTNV
jgi:hypothetical protein